MDAGFAHKAARKPRRLRRAGSFEIKDNLGRTHLQDELVNYLHFCLTGQLTGLNIPPCAMYLDAIIGGQDLWAGDTPRIGETFISCVAIEGFPHESYPFILDCLSDLEHRAQKWEPVLR